MGTVMRAAGNPNEYNTATFINYDNIIKPEGPFNRFFNDPAIQEILHVRGRNLPGLNFEPESNGAPTDAIVVDKKEDLIGDDNAVNQTRLSQQYYAPEKWAVCNDDIVSKVDI